jgi:hypothetical protein
MDDTGIGGSDPENLSMARKLMVTWQLAFDNFAFLSMAGELITFTVSIEPRVDQCGLFAVEGAPAKFYAQIKDLPYGAHNVSYSWELTLVEPTSAVPISLKLTSAEQI